MRDFLRLVADALQVGDRLADRHDHAQIARGRLPLDDGVAAIAVYGHLVTVDARLVADDPLDELAVSRGESLDRSENLGFDQAAHLQHVRTQAFEIRVELLGKMFALDHCLTPLRFSRSGR